MALLDLKSLHILHSEAATGWGGQEIRVFQESQLLLEKGHRVSIVCQPNSPLAERCQALQQSGSGASRRFGLYPIRMGGPLRAGAFLALYRRIGAIRPHILHTHSSIDSWLVSFCGKLLGIPIVRSRHVSIPVKNYIPKNLIYSYFPDRIIASGEMVGSLISGLNGVSREKVVSIPAGVDMERFDRNISGETFRRELNLSPHQPLIGKIGVIRMWKGHEHFLDAIPRILEKFPNARFVIVGGGPGFEQIRRKTRDKSLDSAVTLLGHREDIPEIIASLDILTLASTSGEATSQVIPQAFSMETPVVATRAGGIPEVLGNGERGILVDIKSAAGLAEGILTLLENPGMGRRLAEKAYRFCRQELTVEKMMDKTTAVYEELLSPGR